jgi:hypothetical protein
VFGYVIENQRQYEKRQSLSCRSTVEGVEDIATVEQSGRSPAQPETGSMQYSVGCVSGYQKKK